VAKVDWVTPALLVGAGIALYLVFRKKSALSQQQFQTSLSNAGLQVESRELGTFAMVDANTSVRLDNFDPNQLNFAQRTLIGLDRFVPGTLLSRLALT